MAAWRDLSSEERQAHVADAKEHDALDLQSDKTEEAAVQAQLDELIEKVKETKMPKGIL